MTWEQPDPSTVVNQHRQILNHHQFAVSGGGSRRFSDSSASGPGGYFVSRHPDEGGEKQVSESHLSAAHVAAHWATHRQRAMDTAHDPHETYQGLWHHEGTSYLDVSDRLPTLGRAINEGLKNRQEAIYDNHLGASVFLNASGAARPEPVRPEAVAPVLSRAQYRLSSGGYL